MLIYQRVSTSPHSNGYEMGHWGVFFFMSQEMTGFVGPLIKEGTISQRHQIVRYIQMMMILVVFLCILVGLLWRDDHSEVPSGKLT